MTETWKDIPGWEGFYQVSDQGRIRSVDRTIPHARYGTVNRKGKVMSPGSNPKGYKIVGLRRNGKAKGASVHTLVLQAFVGPRPPGYEACHNNGDLADNRLENLRWDTSSENKIDIQRHGRNFNLNREFCRRGHPYEGGNLKVRGESRRCKACDRAHAITNYDKRFKPHFEAIANIHYENIIGEGRKIFRSEFEYLLE